MSAPTYAVGLGAAVLAAAFYSIELRVSLSKPVSLRGLPWIFLRLTFDGATAAIVCELLRASFGTLTWFTPVWQISIAALAGPALLRSQLAVIGSGQEDSYYGPANAYGRLRRWLDEAVDGAGA